MFDRKIIKGYQLGSWACVFQRLYPFSQKKKKILLLIRPGSTSKEYGTIYTSPGEHLLVIHTLECIKPKPDSLAMST